MTEITAPAPYNYVTELDYNDEGRVTFVRRQTGDLGQSWQTTTYAYMVDG